jgi:hypothetical protein
MLAAAATVAATAAAATAAAATAAAAAPTAHGTVEGSDVLLHIAAHARALLLQ